MSKSQTQFKLNIPEDIKAWLSEQATHNLRSQSAEIILALKEKMRRQAQKKEADALA